MREVSLIQGSSQGPTHFLAWESLHYRTVCPVFKPGFPLGCLYSYSPQLAQCHSGPCVHPDLCQSGSINRQGPWSHVHGCRGHLGPGAGRHLECGFLLLLSPVSTQDTSATLATCSWWFFPNNSLVGCGLNFGSLGQTRPAKIHKDPLRLPL